mmetsp:Transcript_15494/g.44861  ORF Transcript_15494/g.44861 Transcript_15494/m.44861 type:complete len:273 (-) Transcript_15494:956-1774(-)
MFSISRMGPPAVRPSTRRIKFSLMDESSPKSSAPSKVEVGLETMRQAPTKCSCDGKGGRGLVSTAGPSSSSAIVTRLFQSLNTGFSCHGILSFGFADDQSPVAMGFRILSTISRFLASSLDATSSDDMESDSSGSIRLPSPRRCSTAALAAATAKSSSDVTAALAGSLAVVSGFFTLSTSMNSAPVPVSEGELSYMFCTNLLSASVRAALISSSIESNRGTSRAPRSKDVPSSSSAPALSKVPSSPLLVPSHKMPPSANASIIRRSVSSYAN